MSPKFVGGSRIEWVEKPVPVPGPGELLLEIKANALCGSERGQFVHGSGPTPGHEGAGIVVAVGTETGTQVGAKGAVFLMDFCGQCRSCKLGFTNQCLSKRADMGFTRDGAYGRYEVIHENIFFPINQDVSAADATLLLDIMGTNGHALERCQMVRPDIESILVMGAGPIGLGLLAMAKIVLGAAVKVAVADYVPYRLKLVEQLGGLPVRLVDESLEAGLRGHRLFPVDIAVDTSGKQAARESALQSLAKRGALICVGHGEGLSLKVSTDLIAPERAILGSEYFRYNELPTNLARFAKHSQYLRQIITHRFGPDELQQAFELFFKGDTGKVVIES